MTSASLARYCVRLIIPPPSWRGSVSSVQHPGAAPSLAGEITCAKERLVQSVPPSPVTTTQSSAALASPAAAGQRSPWLTTFSAWLENEAILGYVLMTPA